MKTIPSVLLDMERSVKFSSLIYNEPRIKGLRISVVSLRECLQ